MYNAVRRLEKARKPEALVKNFHAHWTTRGLDGHIYSESFQEMGGVLFRMPLEAARFLILVRLFASTLTARSTLATAAPVVGVLQRLRRSVILFFCSRVATRPNASQRVRVLRGSGMVELLGRIETIR